MALPSSGSGYLNFAIEVTALPDNRFRIAVQSSPVGEATVEVASPFTADEIANIIDILGRTRSVSRVEETQAARQFGQKLFDFLIHDNKDINAAYFASLDRAGSAGLRLQLSIEKAGALAQLPWELLRDPQRDFLALSRSTPIVRYTRQLNTRPPVPITMPLRVLVMISAPSNFPPLDVEDEWKRLQDGTKTLRENGRIQLERLDDAALITLQRRLRSEDFHVFHYIGHSAFDEKTQQGMLALEDENNHARLISGADLSRELGEESTFRLVILNSCQSARSDEKDAFSGIASSIVTRGMPAVVAMQYPISDQAARAFSEEFYRAIAETLPIDSAMSEARRAIVNQLQNSEWANPVLYMRAPNGVLFRQTVQMPAVPLKESASGPTLQPRAIVAALILIVLLAGVLFTLLRPDGGLLTPTATATITPSPEATADARRANLEIVTLRSAPSLPAPGQNFRLLIGVRNTGEVASGPFNWTWSASPNLLNALDGEIDNVPAGATKNFSLTYSYGWWGSYDSIVNIDIDGDVEESDERDNLVTSTITLSNEPFDIDFSFLPNGDIITPPLTLVGGEFEE
ncbi:MAG: CHAT domain-containing protein, partial [Burkholderiales bacterium]|nr:CHAT domain-containing protein [Anaerolineae bacterium]